ncbi:hypothetical protein C1645_812341 [Glomus cerebriforme]|uniref:Uncharacterized protein n=1 Tax=Glomus cerebriforme TaxID=658196 RepID=A0A397TUN0_9GLOM|nr:hypothetical protein C1645_812341 [Glomus cerebriforme]
MLESLKEEGSSASAIQKGSHKIARRANYMAVVQLRKNAELEVVYLETSRPNFTQDKRLRDHKKLICFSKDSIDTTRNILKLKKIFNQSLKRQNLTIFTINIMGDVIELYAIRKESSIYKYCLIEEATILLHMTSPSAIYPLIHTLITLRTAIACTIHKILYSSDSGDSEHSSMFNQAYSDLLVKLSASLINEAWIHLISWKRNLLSEIEASEINPIVELFLKYEVIRYQKKLMHIEIQTNNTTRLETLKHDHEEENNRQIMNELKVFRQHLLNYNKRTFKKFMQDIEKEYREWVIANKRLQCKVEDLKMQVWKAEKELASIKSDSSH